MITRERAPQKNIDKCILLMTSDATLINISVLTTIIICGMKVPNTRIQLLKINFVLLPIDDFEQAEQARSKM